MEDWKRRRRPSTATTDGTRKINCLNKIEIASRSKKSKKKTVRILADPWNPLYHVLSSWLSLDEYEEGRKGGSETKRREKDVGRERKRMVHRETTSKAISTCGTEIEFQNELILAPYYST